MALDLPVFFKRTGSAIVFAVIMLGGLLWTDWAFLALVTLIQVLCLHEYCKLMKLIYTDAHWPSWVELALQFIGFLFIGLFAKLNFFLRSPAQWISAVIPLLIILLPVSLMLISVLSKKNSLSAFVQSFGGLFYIVMPVIMLMGMRHNGALIPIALILMIWTNDTMAYLVGSFIGKHPLSSISPKKTWEGTIGGAVLTIVGAGIWGHYSSHYHMADWMALAFCATVAGNLGDLLESKLKRMAGVKDSGKIMPGHGGALDRFDSLLVAIPFAYCYANFFMNSY